MTAKAPTDSKRPFRMLAGISVITDLDGVTATATEVNYAAGVTSAIQTQMDTKAPAASPTFTGTVIIPTPFTLGAVSVLPTGTELNFVDGVTSAIQTQLDTKSPIASPTFTGTVTGTFAGAQTGLHYDAAAPTDYGADGAVSPAIAVASLSKATAGAYTLAAPGAGNINKTILVYSTTAAAHVVTVTGLAGGTTMTYAAAIGTSMTLYAISATAWNVMVKNGVTQT